MWEKYNPNPRGSHIGDCVIRAITMALGETWYEAYIELCIKGFELCDMPSSNKVWGALLKSYGFHRYIISDDCPNCYTIKDFAKEHPVGAYVVCTGTHVVTVIDENYYDSWDSGNESPVFYWTKEE